jgi:hypothetical protein
VAQTDQSTSARDVAGLAAAAALDAFAMGSFEFATSMTLGVAVAQVNRTCQGDHHACRPAPATFGLDPEMNLY